MILSDGKMLVDSMILMWLFWGESPPGKETYSKRNGRCKVAVVLLHHQAKKDFISNMLIWIFFTLGVNQLDESTFTIFIKHWPFQLKYKTFYILLQFYLCKSKTKWVGNASRFKDIQQVKEPCKYQNWPFKIVKLNLFFLNQLN